MASKFQHLNVPDQWNHYWSKYPNGYTILEALLNWVKQVDDMVDLINNWDNYLVDFVEQFDENLRESVADMLNDWLADGTLAEIINEDVLNMKVSTEDFNRYVGVKVQALGNGTDESAAVQSAVDQLIAFGGGKLIFPNKTVIFNNISIPEDLFIKIEGQGRSTILKNTTGQLFIIGGSGNTDYFAMQSLRIESTNNNDYNKPLFDLKYVRNVSIDDVSSNITGTGTLFRLDSTYCITMSNCMLRTGRYGVAFDMDNITSSGEQQDTFIFNNVVIFGNLGVIQRRTGGNYHGNTFDGLKVLNLITDGDFGSYAETSTTSTYSAGATQINVASVSGFSPSDPIVIDFGEYVELNKIASISGSTIYLTKGLQFAHPTSCQILKGGVAVSLANPFNTIMTGCHFEGQAVGIMIDGGKGLDFVSNYSGVGEFVRLCGDAQDINIGTTIMDGTDRNIVVKIPSYNALNTNLARINMNGPFVKPSGSPAITTYEGLDKNTQFTANIINTGVYEHLINMQSGQGTSVQERMVENANEKFRRTYDGELRWRDQVSIDYHSENTVGTSDGGHFRVQGTWNGGHLVMGGHHLWIDVSNRLRIKYGVPTSDLDGAVIGGQS